LNNLVCYLVPSYGFWISSDSTEKSHKSQGQLTRCDWKHAVTGLKPSRTSRLTEYLAFQKSGCERMEGKQ